MPNYKEFKLYKGDVSILFDEENHAYWTHSKTEKKKDGTPKMERLCGVTSFIGIIDKPALIPWAVKTTVQYIREHLADLEKDPKEILKLAQEEANNQKDIAGEIGKAIHKWVEQHIKGEQPEMPEDERVLTGVNSFLDWAISNKVNFLQSEKVIYSRQHNFVGTLDIIAEIEGKKYLLDIKTGNSLYAEVKLQTAAYLVAYQEETESSLSGRWALRISKETKQEYNERMAKKNLKEIPPYKVFEAIYLDNKPELLQTDFDGFMNALSLYRWKQSAEKNLDLLKNAA